MENYFEGRELINKTKDKTKNKVETVPGRKFIERTGNDGAPVVTSKGIISNNIEKANTQSIEEYKKATENVQKESAVEKNGGKEKSNVKKKPANSKKPNARFTSNKKRLAAICISSGIIFSGILGAAVVEAGHRFEERREDCFNELLGEIKEQIAGSADTTPDKVKVYDDSTKVSSNTDQIKYRVVVDGVEYSYVEVHDTDGKRLIKNEIMDKDIIEAIDAVADIQGKNTKASLGDLKRAEKFLEEIKNGERTLSMKSSIESRLDGIRAEESGIKSIFDDDGR